MKQVKNQKAACTKKAFTFATPWEQNLPLSPWPMEEARSDRWYHRNCFSTVEIDFPVVPSAATRYHLGWSKETNRHRQLSLSRSWRRTSQTAATGTETRKPCSFLRRRHLLLQNDLTHRVVNRRCPKMTTWLLSLASVYFFLSRKVSFALFWVFTLVVVTTRFFLGALRGVLLLVEELGPRK